MNYSDNKLEKQYQLYETMHSKLKAELKEATVAKLQSEVARLNYRDVNIDELMASSSLHPAQAIVFHVGEEPELPMYAHHFKAMESKLTCGGHMADVALQGVTKLLQRFFPGHTQYWSEFEDDDEDESIHNDRVLPRNYEIKQINSILQSSNQPMEKDNIIP